MDSVRVDANLRNGGKSSSDLDLREVVDKEEEETNSLLPSAVNGGTQRKRQKNARRKVQWNDRNGNKLVEVVEFQPSDSSDSEDDSSDGFSIWDYAIVGCAQLCCCLGGQRSHS
ncbi:uncharacterized protein [Typha latifolia]|uniref:uncharacterized protein isoform X7 n=1 Tax=Typha latifolia TaxID=4733 RepID=UPI003C2E64E4